MPKYRKSKFLLETKLRTTDYAHKEKGLDKGKDHTTEFKVLCLGSLVELKVMGCMLYKSLILDLSNPKRLVLHPSCRTFIDCETLGNYCGFKEYYNSPFLMPLGRVLLPDLQHALAS